MRRTRINRDRWATAVHGAASGRGALQHLVFDVSDRFAGRREAWSAPRPLTTSNFALKHVHKEHP
jgi:hypothetical protein